MKRRIKTITALELFTKLRLMWPYWLGRGVHPERMRFISLATCLERLAPSKTFHNIAMIIGNGSIIENILKNITK